jgi:hypothetical protein
LSVAAWQELDTAFNEFAKPVLNHVKFGSHIL